MNDVTAKQSSIFIIGSFHEFNWKKEIETFNKIDHAKTFPRNVTLGFRGVFWNVASDVTKLFDGRHRILWLDKEWDLISVYVFRSFKRQIQLYLDDNEHIFIAVNLVPVDELDKKWINEESFNRGMTEQKLLDSLYAAIALSGIELPLATARHRRGLPARFFFSVESDVIDTSEAALICFYAFAQLIIWQVDRDHAAIELKPEQIDVNQKLTAVLRNRARIINIKRLFLTKNITHDSNNATIVSAVKKQMNIEEKSKGFMEINDLIEKFFLTSSQIRQNKSTKILNITALIIAVIGLPTSIMSMLIALQDNTLIVKSPKTIVEQEEYLLFLFGSVIVSTVAILLVWTGVRSTINRDR